MRSRNWKRRADPDLFRGYRRRRIWGRLFTQRTWTGIALALIATGLALNLPTLQRLLAPKAAGSFSGYQIRVIDGDTVHLPDGERVRVLNIDTPEMPPRAQCDVERDLAFRAQARTQEMMLAGEVKLYAGLRDRDRYGRQLRRIEVDGRDLGEQLISEGLAKRWTGSKAQWC